jgi:hypothetical protein
MSCRKDFEWVRTKKLTHEQADWRRRDIPSHYKPRPTGILHFSSSRILTMLPKDSAKGESGTPKGLEFWRINHAHTTHNWPLYAIQRSNPPDPFTLMPRRQFSVGLTSCISDESTNTTTLANCGAGSINGMSTYRRLTVASSL